MKDLEKIDQYELNMRIAELSKVIDKQIDDLKKWVEEKKKQEDEDVANANLQMMFSGASIKRLFHC